MESLYHAEFYHWFVERYRLEPVDATSELFHKAMEEYLQYHPKENV